MYSTSYTGKLNLADWTLLWTDHLAILLLPVVFLHFCLSFPERRLPHLPGLADPRGLHAGAGPGGSLGREPGPVRATPRARCSGGSRRPSTAPGRSTSPRSSRSPSASCSTPTAHPQRDRARKQMKWLVWGTGAGSAALLPVLRDPLRAGQRAAPGDGAGRLRPARADPAVARLRGREAPADGRGADLPPDPRLHPGDRGDRRDLPARRGLLRLRRCSGGRRSPTSASSPSSPPWS